MRYFEVFVWCVGIAVFVGLFVGSIAAIVAMLIEVAAEDTRRVKAWFRAVSAILREYVRKARALINERKRMA